jgi:hypothetical protein
MNDNMPWRPEQIKREAGRIYKAAVQAVVDDVNAADGTLDLLVVEHILRAVLEVLSPEQRASILRKVSR